MKSTFTCPGKTYLPNLLRYHRTAVRLGVYQRSAKTAFIVGTVLNLINQPQALLGLFFLDIPPTACIKLLLTYAVPFFVATHGALTAFEPDRNKMPNKPLF